MADGFTRATWTDWASPDLEAANLNRIEKGIEDAHIGLTEKISNKDGVPSIIRDTEANLVNYPAGTAGRIYIVSDLSKIYEDDGTAWVLKLSLGWTDITGKPSSYPPSSHNHNDLYYTKSEIDSSSGSGSGGATNASQLQYTAPYTGAIPSNAQLKMAEMASVRDFGARGLAEFATTGSITSGSITLTVAGGTWEVGMGIIVHQGVSTSSDLVAKVTAVNGTTLTLDTAAGNTVSGATVQHDDTWAIQAALNNAEVVYFPPVSGGYGVNLKTGVEIPSFKTLQGCGYPGRLVRVGRYYTPASTARFLVGRAERQGGTTVTERLTIRGLYINGRGPAAGALASDTSALCIRLSCADGHVNRYITIEDNEIHNWPGAVIHVVRIQNFSIGRNKIHFAQRGGIVLYHNSRYGAINDNVIHHSKDDAIALNADTADSSGRTDGPMEEITISGNYCRVAAVRNYATDDPGGLGANWTAHEATGKPIALRGCQDVTVTGNTCVGGKHAGILVEDEGNIGDPVTNAAFKWNRITISGNTIKLPEYGNGTESAAILVRSWNATDLLISGNTIYKPDEKGIWVICEGASTVIDHVQIVGNHLVDVGTNDPSAGHAIYTSGPSGCTIRGIQVHDNTIVRPRRIAIAIDGGARDVSIKGNVIRDVNWGGAAADNVDAIYINAVKFHIQSNVVTDARGTKITRFACRVAGGSYGWIAHFFFLLSDSSQNVSAVSVAAGLTSVTDAGGHKTA